MEQFTRLLAIVADAALPGVAQASSYGTPSLKVHGRFMARLRDTDTLVVRCPVEEKAMLMEAAPAIFYETDHYKGHAAVLVRLAAADDATLRGRLERAWRMQAPARIVAQFDRSRNQRQEAEP